MRRASLKALKAMLPFGVAVLLSSAIAASAQAQGAVITGRVVSAEGQPLSTARVAIVELSLETVTGPNGAFTLDIPSARVRDQAATLRVRAIGHTPVSRQVTLRAGSQEQNFTLALDAFNLSAVIVTGTVGEMERVKLPFTVGRIDEAELIVPAVNPISQLSGRIAGVTVSQASGRPGAPPQILLRAPTMIDGSGRTQEPLYIVDGVILGASIVDLSALDVEKIEVVKGAAAASLYGARAGAGVVQITTKSGRQSQEGLRFVARSEAGFNALATEIRIAQNHPYLMTADGSQFCADATCTQTFDYTAEVIKRNNGLPYLTPIFNGSSPTNTFQDGRWPGQTYNHVEDIFSPGAFVQSTFDVSGRSGATNFFASATQLKQGGPAEGLEGLRRGSFRLNLDHAIGTEWLIEARTFYSHGVQDGQFTEGAGSVFFDLTRMPAGVDLHMTDATGDIIIVPSLDGENENPVYALRNRVREDVRDRFLGGVTVRHSPLPWVDIDGNFSFDRSNVSRIDFADKGYRTARASSLNSGFIFKDKFYNQSFNTSFNAAIRRTLAPGLNTRLSARFLYEQQDFDLSEGSGLGLAAEDLPSLDNASTSIDIESDATSIRQVGYFLAGAADYKDRYIVDALVRRDGSSLFGSDERWATYYRGSVAWRLSQESWWPVPQLGEFKLRYSRGTAGGRPRFDAQYEVYDVDNGIVSPVSFGNTKLKPETVTEQEFGVDLVALNRIGVNLTYARSTIEDQILRVFPQAASGFTSQWNNAGTLETNTWELTVDVPILRTRDLNWSTRFVYDRSRSEITKLNRAPFQYGVPNQGAEAIFFARVGEAIGTIYGDRFATGCGDLPASFQAGCAAGEFEVNDDGYLVWVGAGNTWRDGLWGTVGPTIRTGQVANWGHRIIAQDETGNTFLRLGKTLPDFKFAVSQTLTYKRLSVYALLDASIGRDVWNEGRHWSYFENYSADQDQAGKSAETRKPQSYYGTNGLYNRLLPNTHFMEDASFAKLRELSVSFRVPRLVSGNDVTFGVVGRNLFTITDYTGFDPEVGVPAGDAGSGVVNAIDVFRYPNSRTFTFSATVSF